jgi:hypothetical protein
MLITMFSLYAATHLSKDVRANGHRQEGGAVEKKRNKTNK